jgi:hypothetical protein
MTLEVLLFVTKSEVPVVRQPKCSREIDPASRKHAPPCGLRNRLLRRFGLLCLLPDPYRVWHCDHCAKLSGCGAWACPLNFGQQWPQQSGGPQSSLTGIPVDAIDMPASIGVESAERAGLLVLSAINKRLSGAMLRPKPRLTPKLAHFLCDAQEMSESQILDADAVWRKLLGKQPNHL